MSNGNGSNGAGGAPTFEDAFCIALGHGIAALNVISLSQPGPASREWSESAAVLRCVLRAIRPPNGRELPSGRAPDVVEVGT